MDPFEEFEFKPLTNGLGFHQNKNKSSLSDELRSKSDLPKSIPTGLLEEEEVQPRNQAEAYKDLMRTLSQDNEIDLDEPGEGLQNNEPAQVAQSSAPMSGPDSASKDLLAQKSKSQKSLDDLPKVSAHRELPELELSEPLPRKPDAPKISAIEADTALPDLNPTPETPPMSELPDIIDGPEPRRSTFDIPGQALKDSRTQRGASNSPKPSHLEPAPVSFSAAILDFVFVIALSGIFLVSLLLVTQVPLQNVMFNFQNDLFTRLSFIVLLLAVMQMYVVVARSFFGCTLGEWTFDLQMGSDKDIESPLYPLRIVLRSLVTVATGLVTLSILSFLLQKDLAAKLAGVQLYRYR
jgi:uncharacterized RDD family membrane protein YckC